MIKTMNDNIFDTPADAIVITVNTEGVMGKGIAKESKRLYPYNYQRYRMACQRNELSIGDIMFTSEKQKLIINFPTKRYWRKPSELLYITIGLSGLANLIRSKGITSIAIPPLGCGNGGLNWKTVRAMIVTWHDEMIVKYPNLTIYLYEPNNSYNRKEDIEYV